MMENFKLNNIEKSDINKDFILDHLNLSSLDGGESGFLRIESNREECIDSNENREDIKKYEKSPINNPEELSRYFESIDMVRPDRISRPKGDTTFFTTAGVQRIETLIRENGTIEKGSFMIAQPVIRSQFMDKIKDGVSSSFINFSVEHIGATRDDFINFANKFIALVEDRGVRREDMRFTLEDVSDKWGDRSFTKTVLTVFVNNIELGECIYMQDYPITKEKRVAVVDIGFGIERLNWGIDSSEYYLPEFAEFYSTSEDNNKIINMIDYIRSMTLISSDGIVPSNKNHGYRMRQFSKRFVARKIGTNVDTKKLVRIAYEFWNKWGTPMTLSESEVFEVISAENDRNYNSMFLSLLEKYGGPKIYIDINQSTGDFLKQVNVSLPLETKDLINRIIKETKWKKI